MSEDGHLFTCAICGEGQMSDAAMQTHMYLAHVYNEISCMFCDLRGVTAEEMTLHINSVHCSDSRHDDDASNNNSMQWHLNGVQRDTDHPRTNQTQASRLPNVESGRNKLPDACGMTSAVNDTAGSQHILSHASIGNSRNIDRDKQQKRKLSGTLIASSSFSAQENTVLPAACVSSYSDAQLTSNCCTSSSNYLESTSSSLPKMTNVANGMDKMSQDNRFVEYSFLYRSK